MSLSHIFGMSAPAAPVAPTPAPPPVMPDPNAPDVLAAQRLALNKAMSGGRSSTGLTTLAGGTPMSSIAGLSTYGGTAAGG
jgi:hypothetical protein